jgi:cytochrome c-type biogenesis protein CcmI
MEVLIAALVVAGAVALVAWPFLRPQAEPDLLDERRESLELAKQVKYREIRDLELDMQAGKIDRDEWERLDRELRREAIAILAELDGSSTAAVTRGATVTQDDASGAGRRQQSEQAPPAETGANREPARPIL